MNQNIAYKAALEWYLDVGVDESLQDNPDDKTALKKLSRSDESALNSKAPNLQTKMSAEKSSGTRTNNSADVMKGASESAQEALELSRNAKTLDDLKNAIENFGGLSVKKTATNMVFADGNADAKIMVIGEAPGADEDKMGRPFVGASGKLLDKILNAIELDRQSDDPFKSVYVSNILNWRPPGNRTPTDTEIQISLPFIEKHIQLIQPDILILFGATAAKPLLASQLTISKLRGKLHDYNPVTHGLVEQNSNESNILALATYHPSYLLRNPVQKKAVWTDMLTLKKHLKK